MDTLGEILKQLHVQGFSYRQTKRGHWMVYNPGGLVVTTLAGTASDPRSIRNGLSALRRAGFQWKGR